MRLVFKRHERYGERWIAPPDYRIDVESRMSSATTLQIFLSYASQDGALTQTIESALLLLSSKLGEKLKVVRDIHNFEIGRSIQEEVMENLSRSDILLIIYTEALKRSHSYTGMELGAFKYAIFKEKKSRSKPKRIIASVYFDNPPDAEAGILNIELNPKSLSKGQKGIDELDPGENLQKFFCQVSDLVIDKNVKSDKKIVDQIKKEKHEIIKSEIIPELKRSIFLVIASIMENGRLEQAFFSIHWPPRSQDVLASDDILSSAELRPGKSEDMPQAIFFDIFGLKRNDEPISWDDFVSLLRQEQHLDADFTINSITDATRSALKAGAVDNEQIMLGKERKVYRIIVTRHFTYYDGSRSMHMYFIPFLSRYSKEPASVMVAMVDLAVKFRGLFLYPRAKFSAENFELFLDSPAKFRDHVVEFARFFTLIDDESHAFGLDDKTLFRDAFGVDAKVVNDTFKRWNESKGVVLKSAAEIVQCGQDLNAVSALMSCWLDCIGEFFNQTRSINQNVGRRGAVELSKFFRNIRVKNEKSR